MLEKLQKEYKLKVIKDLGMFEKNEGSYRLRKVVLLCPQCRNEFTVNNTQRNKHREVCFSCLKDNCVTNKYPRLYNIWKGMRSRVNSTEARKVYSYSSKNITVCEEWQYFDSFKEWALNNGYSDNLSIDRKDNDSGYSPDNCRWANATTQSENTRKLYAHNSSKYRGVSKNKSGQFHAYVGIGNSRINIGYYPTALEAAKARDTCILDNSLGHTLNDVLEQEERVESNLYKTTPVNNKSGYIGVSFIQRLKDTNKPWFTQITAERNRVFSKYYTLAEEAAFFREEFIHSNPTLTQKLKRNFTNEEYMRLKTLYLV